jgi:hypothetical protein
LNEVLRAPSERNYELSSVLYVLNDIEAEEESLEDIRNEVRAVLKVALSTLYDLEKSSVISNARCCL